MGTVYMPDQSEFCVGGLAFIRVYRTRIVLCAHNVRLLLLYNRETSFGLARQAKLEAQGTNPHVSRMA